MTNTHLFVVRLRDSFAIKVIYVYKAFTSEEKLLSYLKDKITYRDKDEDILIVDVTCMKYFKETDSYDVMAIWEYNEERDNWLWSYSGYLSRLLFKLPIERSAEGFLPKDRNEVSMNVDELIENIKINLKEHYNNLCDSDDCTNCCHSCTLIYNIEDIIDKYERSNCDKRTNENNN